MDHNTFLHLAMKSGNVELIGKLIKLYEQRAK